MTKIIKEEDGKMIIETEDMMLANLVGEYLWSVRGVRFAGSIKEHPYLEKPKIIVSATDPKKAVQEACKKIVSDIEGLKKHVK